MSGFADERQFIEAAAERAAGRTAAIARDSRLPGGTVEDYTSHRSIRELLWTLLPEPTTDGILLLPPRNAVLLAGPRGSGKRNLAGTFLAWASGAGCRCFSVDRFLASLVPEDRLPDYLAKLMSSAGSTPLAAVIDAGSGERRQRADSGEHRRPDPLLSAAAAAFGQVPEELPLTLILTSSDLDAPRDLDLPGLLVLPVGRPGKKEREEFFAEHRNRMPRRSETAAGGASSQEAGRENAGGSAQPNKLPSYECSRRTRTA